MRRTVVQELIQKVDGRPDRLTVEDLRGRADDNTYEADERKHQGNGNELRKDGRRRLFGARCKVGCIPVYPISSWELGREGEPRT